jgi:hypothetical protein
VVIQATNIQDNINIIEAFGEATGMDLVNGPK